MTESPTPKTDALREVIIGQYKEDDLTGNGMGNLLAALTDIETLERERDELKEQLEQSHKQYRFSSVCRELQAENERLKRITTWPHDADPFTSPDHDNDETIYNETIQ